MWTVVEIDPAALEAVQVYTPPSSLLIPSNVTTPPDEGKTRPPNIHVMEGAGSPVAAQEVEWRVFSKTVLLLADVITGGTDTTDRRGIM